MQNTTTTTATDTATSTGSQLGKLLNRGGSDIGGELSIAELQAQLQSCLQKLDLVLSNQIQLERILLSQVAILNQGAGGASSRGSTANA